MTNKALPYMSPYRNKDFPWLLMANGVRGRKAGAVGAPADWWPMQAVFACMGYKITRWHITDTNRDPW